MNYALKIEDKIIILPELPKTYNGISDFDTLNAATLASHGFVPLVEGTTPQDTTLYNLVETVYSDRVERNWVEKSAGDQLLARNAQRYKAISELEAQQTARMLRGAALGDQASIDLLQAIETPIAVIRATLEAVS